MMTPLWKTIFKVCSSPFLSQDEKLAFPLSANFSTCPVFKKIAAQWHLGDAQNEYHMFIDAEMWPYENSENLLCLVVCPLW